MTTNAVKTRARNQFAGADSCNSIWVGRLLHELAAEGQGEAKSTALNLGTGRGWSSVETVTTQSDESPA